MVCTKSNPTRRRCGICKMSYYCSVSCQQKDWKVHKTYCRKGVTLAENDKIVKEAPLCRSALIEAGELVHIPRDMRKAALEHFDTKWDEIKLMYSLWLFMRPPGADDNDINQRAFVRYDADNNVMSVNKASTLVYQTDRTSLLTKSANDIVPTSLIHGSHVYFIIMENK